MSTALLKARAPVATSYAELLRRVKETFFLGQQRIEREKVLTYWETGRHINDHIKTHGGRSEYGKKILGRLADDLHLDVSVLRRCARFAAAFPIQAARPELSWAHYRTLITVPDETKRNELARLAEKNNWNSRELEVKVHGFHLSKDGREKEGTWVPLTPKRGVVYTYRVLEPDSAMRGEASPVLDLGFRVSRTGDFLKGFKAEDIVASRESKGASEYQLVRSTHGEEALYTYRAWVERVIDADTLFVFVDLGFDTGIRQYLRLSGIDAPEIDTAAGKRAAEFVKRQLAQANEIIIRTTRSDKYDRYLAAVFIPAKSGEIFLNNLLLENHHAVRI